jgi:hypothetical protein
MDALVCQKKPAEKERVEVKEETSYEGIRA